MTVNNIPVFIDNIEGRNKKNKLFRALVIAMSVLTVVPIVLIVSKIIINGIGQINFNFFIQTSPDSLQAMTAIANNQTIPGGIANGILGTFLIVLVSSAMAVPTGIMIGIYLYENQGLRYSNFLRNITEILQGVPSIVLGIISYLWIVKNITNGFSAFAGSVALSIMMLPMIIRSTEETMKMIPNEIREAAFCDGGAISQSYFKGLDTYGIQRTFYRNIAFYFPYSWRNSTSYDDCIRKLSHKL